ncbi:hypothetical protein [Candidatus Clostridium helianthi]|uniref:Uncharacterized protein n=1 Tax=Candidatus Clostridium helianthi TaxID=3381660 RepID=A0ABW8SBH6_9CLOT
MKMNDNDIYNNAFLLLNSEYNIENEENSLLFDKLTYIIFCIAILPKNEYSLSILNQFSNVYLGVKDLQHEWCFTDEFISLINMSYYKMKEKFPLKKGIKFIAKILREQLINEPFRNGIEIGVLENIFDLKNTPYLKEGLPYYSRIGLGYHSGMVANEEQQLLEDAFFMLALAEKEYNIMNDVAIKLKKDKKVIKENQLEIVSRFNRNVCTLCRNGLINFFAYFEALMNGISLDYVYKNENMISEEERFLLKGKNSKGTNYIKMGDRIEYIQKIIGGKVIYKTKNHQQLKEKCFIELLNKFKNQRDVSVHFSIEKGKILIPPDIWLLDLKSIAKYCIDASQKIWIACYHNENYPDYLRKFDYNLLYNNAKIRVETENS